MNFKNGAELVQMSKDSGLSMSKVCIEREVEISSRSEDDIVEDMRKSYDIMRNAVKKGQSEELKSMGGLIGGEAKKLNDRMSKNRPVCGEVMSKAMSAAMGVMEVNASMGLIVAAPTAGSCGILPGALITVGDEFGKSDEEIVNAMFAAGAVGIIITRNATVSGAEGGCQAETGAAAAMAAAGIVELMGGSTEQALDAAAICLKNVMGLVCDPIAGLVEAPCQKRNAIGVANALISAEMVLAGVPSVIPFDEAVQAMYEVGRRLPVELRETALGGAASTPTGCMLCKQIFS